MPNRYHLHRGVAHLKLLLCLHPLQLQLSSPEIQLPTEENMVVAHPQHITFEEKSLSSTPQQLLYVTYKVRDDPYQLSAPPFVSVHASAARV